MKTAEDFEFEALLTSVVEERVAAAPAGLQQRLMARFEQAVTAERIQAARKPFAFAESVKSPRSAASLWLAAGAHAALALTIFGLAAHHVFKAPLRQDMISTLIEPPMHTTRIAADATRGGGGHHDPALVSAGRLPRFAERQILPPMAPPVIEPRLPVEPTVVVQSDIRMTNNNMPNLGAPTSSLIGNSLGNGRGTGIGSGDGAGVGPGTGANIGGGVMHAGGSIKAPVVLYSVEPEFSEEARRAKFSGNVQVYLWVDEQGNPSHIRVIRGVGMGLDEKAVDAVRQYKFKPAMQNGKPVKVDMYVNVEFNIY